MDIEPLLARLGALAPGFGRAQHDIHAIVSRGRSEDYKGVMQNCRLVLEALLRALVADQLKQTPGKAMLDELITKFRQQANAGLIPMNILAHMGTVQAWGNLSSHDQASRLTDDGVKVGKGEVMASLNSMVAILDWYVESYGETAPRAVAQAPSQAPSSAARPSAAAAGKKSPVVPIVAGIALAVAGAGGYLATRPQQPPPVVVPVALPAAAPFAALDALYRAWNEPIPPPLCRSSTEAAALGARPGELAALEALPANRSSEAWYLIARAQLDQKLDALPAATRAIACPGFAAASNLAGRIAIQDSRLPDAMASFQAAVDSAPDFHKARFNLGAVLLKSARITDGMKQLEQLTAADPKFADAHLLLGMAYEGQGQQEAAKAAFCAALANGKTEARERCAR